MAMEVVANPYTGLPCSDKKRWLCVYPAYLNARKTLSEGRRVPKKKAVDNPLCTEIRDVCMSQQLGVEFEAGKHYPREQARDQIHSGRVRVQLKNEDGSPLNESITNRKELLAILCELIPKLKTRQGGGSRGGGGGGDSGGGGGGSGTSGGGAQASSKKKKGRRK